MIILSLPLTLTLSTVNWCHATGLGVRVYIFHFIFCMQEFCLHMSMGISADTIAIRVSIHNRQEDSSVQHDSVAHVGSNFKNLNQSSLF